MHQSSQVYLFRWPVIWKDLKSFYFRMLLQFKWGFQFLSTFLSPWQPPRAISAFTNTTCDKDWLYAPCPYPWPQRLWCPLWCQGKEQAKLRTIFSCLEPNSICHLYFSRRNQHCSASIPPSCCPQVALSLVVTSMGRIFAPCQGKQDRRSVLGHPIQGISWDRDQQWCKFLILTFSKSPCKLSSTKCGLKVSLGSNTGPGPHLKYNTHRPKPLCRAFQTLVLLSPPPPSNVPVWWVQKEMWESQGPMPPGWPAMGKLFPTQPWKSGCHMQEGFNLLLIFLSQILLKDAMDDNLGEWYSFANHMWSI